MRELYKEIWLHTLPLKKWEPRSYSKSANHHMMVDVILVINANILLLGSASTITSNNNTAKFVEVKVFVQNSANICSTGNGPYDKRSIR